MSPLNRPAFFLVYLIQADGIKLYQVIIISLAHTNKSLMSSGTFANSIRSLRLHLHVFFSLFSAAYLAESYQWQPTPYSYGVIFPCDPSSSSSSSRTSVLHEGLGRAPCRWQKHPCPHTAPRKGKGGWLRTSAAATPSAGAGDTARPPQRRRSPPGVPRLPRQPTAPPAPAPQEGGVAAAPRPAPGAG